MKKIKLLKTIGCVALVATPIVIAPIVLTTSCSSADPIDPNARVKTIDKIVMTQNGVELKKSLDDSSQYDFTYKTYTVLTAEKMKIEFNNIVISFFINGENEAIPLLDLYKDISFELVCGPSTDGTYATQTCWLNGDKEIFTTAASWKECLN